MSENKTYNSPALDFDEVLEETVEETSHGREEGED